MRVRDRQDARVCAVTLIAGFRREAGELRTALFFGVSIEGVKESKWSVSGILRDVQF